MTFRPEIQGLRAIAILLVLLFHIFPNLLQGGFVGVDVFFVLSGFLITSLLLHESDGGSVSLVAFWARRIRRLLPAATLVLLVTLAATPLLLPETQYRRTGEQVLASALYAQNWLLAMQSTDYLARSETATPVQHFWSLSIEEQFYFVWPVLFYFAVTVAGYGAANAQARRKAIAIVSSTILIFSFAYAIVRTTAADPAAYFVTTARAWELALGGFLATLPALPSWARVASSWLGLTGIAASAYLLRGETQFPNWTALLPTLGAGLFLIGGARHWSLAFLSSRAAMWMGDISYSLYLWHWPVVILLRSHVVEFPQPLGGCILLSLSLLVASLTSVTVEKWFRAGKERSVSWPAYVLGLCLIALVVNPAAGLTYCYRQAIKEPPPQLKLNDPDYPGATILDSEKAVILREGIPLRPLPGVARNDWPRLYNDGCDQRQLSGAQFCEYGNPLGTTTVVLVGDSHAAQYLPTLELLAAYLDWRLRVLTRSACPFNSTPLRRGGIVLEDCQRWKQQVSRLLETSRPDIIVTSGAIPSIYNEVYQVAPVDEFSAGYRSIWQPIADAGIPIIVVRDNPRPFIDVPACASLNPGNLQKCDRKRADVLDQADPIHRAATGFPGVKLLDLSRYFCPGESCPVVIGNVLVYRDGDHITASYATTLAPAFEKVILESLPGKGKRTNATPRQDDTR
ncbi:MAG: acyltransferase [Leptospirales bacterium]|nr:acyltransferase [Leptospirales bacterium]